MRRAEPEEDQPRVWVSQHASAPAGVSGGGWVPGPHPQPHPGAPGHASVQASGRLGTRLCQRGHRRGYQPGRARAVTATTRPKKGSRMAPGAATWVPGMGEAHGIPTSGCQLPSPTPPPTNLGTVPPWAKDPKGFTQADAALAPPFPEPGDPAGFGRPRARWRLRGRVQTPGPPAEVWRAGATCQRAPEPAGREDGRKSS